MRRNYNTKRRRRLYEQDDVNQSAPERDLSYSKTPHARNASDSVDDQIDSLILMYEKNSIRNEDDRIDESLFRKSLLALLREQDEDLEDEPVEDAGEEVADTGTDDDVMDDAVMSDDPAGSETMDAKAATKDIVPDLDIDQFSIKVARLILNYKALEVEKVILNRAKNFLDQNYGDAFVKRYLDTLEEQFGIKHKEFNVSYNEDTPFAVGANPAGAGMSGG